MKRLSLVVVHLAGQCPMDLINSAKAAETTLGLNLTSDSVQDRSELNKLLKKRGLDHFFAKARMDTLPLVALCVNNTPVMNLSSDYELITIRKAVELNQNKKTIRRHRTAEAVMIA